MRNPMSLEGRRILVTGAGSGLGRETAVLLSELGATLTLTGRRPEPLEETRRMLAGSGHQAAPFDLTRCDETPAWLKTLAAAGGPYHGAVHMAGLHSARPLRMLDGAHVAAILEANLGSAVALARAFRQKGCVQAPAALVFTASVAGLAGAPGIAAYAAAKGALVSVTRALALELARERIRVNCLAPGFVETDFTARLKEAVPAEQYEAIRNMHPLGFGQPRDVAHAAAFLLADTSLWITGTTLVVDGGYTAH